MNQRDFANRLRSLFNIDGDLLKDVLTEEEQQQFVRDPVRFYMCCADWAADAIWREIEKRQRNEWQPIVTAPKSTTTPCRGGHDVRGVYFLGYCPDESAHDPQSCICVCWWEPHMHGVNKGGWQGEADYELRPILWRPMPIAPRILETEGR